MANVFNTNMVVNMMQRKAHAGSIAAAGNYKSTVTHIGSSRICDIWGATASAVEDEDDFAALVSGTPNNVVYLWLTTSGVGATASTVKITVELEYDAVFQMPARAVAS